MLFSENYLLKFILTDEMCGLFDFLHKLFEPALQSRPDCFLHISLVPRASVTLSASIIAIVAFTCCPALVKSFLHRFTYSVQQSDTMSGGSDKSVFLCVGFEVRAFIQKRIVLNTLFDCFVNSDFENILQYTSGYILHKPITTF